MAYMELDDKNNRKLKTLQETAREFGLEVMRPAGIELDKLNDPSNVIDKHSIFWDTLKKFRELGFHKLSIPKAFGGTMGTMPYLAQTILDEQFGYADSGLAISLMVSSAPFSIALMSPEAEIRNWARDCAEDKEGSMIGCWALTEPDHGTDNVMAISKAGSDPRLTPEVRGIKKGDEYILNGCKAAWVSNGTIATHALLHFNLDPSMGAHGSAITLCPLDLPGISKGKPLNKLGQRPLNQGEIIFNDVKLHKKYLLVPPGFFGANTLGQTFFGFANSQMGVMFSAQAQAILDESIKFINENTRDGVLLADLEDIRIKIFRMFARVESARLFSRKVADYLLAKPSGSVSYIMNSTRSTFWMASKTLQLFFKLSEKYDSVRTLSKKFTHPDQPSELMEWSKYGIASKIMATETAYDTASKAVQIFGEKGMSPEYPIEKMLRDARASRIEDGVNDTLALAAFENL